MANRVDLTLGKPISRRSEMKATKEHDRFGMPIREPDYDFVTKSGRKVNVVARNVKMHGDSSAYDLGIVYGERGDDIVYYRGMKAMHPPQPEFDMVELGKEYTETYVIEPLTSSDCGDLRLHLIQSEDLNMKCRITEGYCAGKLLHITYRDGEIVSASAG